MGSSTAGTPGASPHPALPPGDVDPTIASTREEFADCLRGLKQAANRSFEQIARISARHGHGITDSTAQNLTSKKRASERRAFTKDSLQGFLIGCGLTEAKHSPWIATYDRLYTIISVSDGSGSAKPRWVFAGPDAVKHFSQRAHGQRAHADGGDLFSGRVEALKAVRTALTTVTGSGLPLVVTGQPGAGKSSVLARAILTLQAEGAGPGVAIHAHTMTLGEVVASIAKASKLPDVTTSDTLLQALSTGSDQQRLLIALDALDEVTSAADRRGIAQLLAALARLPGLRVAVATRPRKTGDSYQAGSLMADLGVTGASCPNLVHLDTDEFFDDAGLRDLTIALLTQREVFHLPPPERAWTTYRANHELAHRLGNAITKRARRNYLVAVLAATHLSMLQNPVDPAASDFDSTQIPDTVTQVINKYVDTLPPREQARTLGLLTALAFARGSGVSDVRWLTFADALGYPATRFDLEEIRRTPAVDYLLQTISASNDRVTRLFHQSLADELIAHGGDRPNYEKRILATLLPVNPQDWLGADTYVRSHVAEHAIEAGLLPELLRDPHFVIAADPNRLLSLLPQIDCGGKQSADIFAVLRQAAHRMPALTAPRRARLLALTAAHLGLPVQQGLFEATVSDGSTQIRWAHSFGPPHRLLLGHRGRVAAAAVGQLGDREVIVSAGADETIRIWDADGQQVGEPLTGHQGAVNDVTVGRIGDCEAIISAGVDSTVRVWNANRRQLAQPLVGHKGSVRHVAVWRLGNRDVIVSAGADETVRIWDAHRQELVHAFVPYRGGIRAMAVGRLNNEDVIVCSPALASSEDPPLLAWDMQGDLAWRPRQGWGYVNTVAIGRLGGNDVIASSVGSFGQGPAILVWNAEGNLLLDPLKGHDGDLTAIDIGQFRGRDVIVSADESNTVRIWDAEGQPIGDPLTGHRGSVTTVAVNRINGNDVIVSAGADESVRIWEASTRSAGQPRTGHSQGVATLAAGDLGGRDVIASAGIGAPVGIWASDGQLVRRLDTTEIASSGRWKKIDPFDVLAHSVGIGPLGDSNVIVTTCRGGGPVRIWEPDGREIERFEPYFGVYAMAFGRLGEYGAIVTVDMPSSGGLHNGRAIARVWVVDGQPGGRPLVGHDGDVTAVAIGRFGGRDVVASAGTDATVRIWDEGRQLSELLDLLEPSISLVFTRDGGICVGSGTALCAWTSRI